MGAQDGEDLACESVRGRYKLKWLYTHTPSLLFVLSRHLFQCMRSVFFPDYCPLFQIRRRSITGHAFPLEHNLHSILKTWCRVSSAEYILYFLPRENLNPFVGLGPCEWWVYWMQSAIAWDCKFRSNRTSCVREAPVEQWYQNDFLMLLQIFQTTESFWN